MYVNIHFVIFSFFFPTLHPWDVIIVQHFPKTCSNAAMQQCSNAATLQSGKNTGQPAIMDTMIIRTKLKSLAK